MPYDAQHALEHPETAAWALRALDPGDAAAFEEHLQSCQQCQEQAAEFAPVVRSLALAAPADIPPPDLLNSTLAAVRNAALAEGSAEPEPEPDPRPELDVPEHHPTSAASRRPAAEDQASTRIYSIAQYQPPAPDETPAYSAHVAKPPTTEDDAPAPVIDLPWWRRHRGGLTSAVAVAAVIIVAAIVVLSRLGGSQSTVAIPLQATTAAKVNGVGAASGQATARQADQSWTYVLKVRGLKPLPGNDVYECWYAAPGSTRRHPILVSAGTFVVSNSGSTTVTMTGGVDPHDFPTMEITAEAPGNGALTGAVLLTGRLSTT
jgi:Anti-sigma-K factor rskA/Putative zinc-finger